MRAQILLITFLLSLFSISSFAQENDQVLTLDEAIKVALENNPDLLAKNATVDAVQAKVKGAKSLFYPQVGFTFIVPFIGRESGISADQLIWDFGRTPNLVKASRANLESTEFERAATREDVILNTKIAYYTVLSERHIVEAEESSVAENEKRFLQTEGFLRAGRVSRIEVTKAEVNLGNAKLRLINARNDLEIAKMNLARAMGVEGDLNYEFKDELDYKKVDMNLERAINIALEKRPDLKSLQAKEVAVRAELAASEKDIYFPVILGRVAYRFEGEGATGPDFIAGVGLRFDIFKGFSDIAEVNQGRANLRRAQAETESLKQEIILEIKRLYLELKSAEESIGVIKASKASAEGTLKLARERYRLEVGSQIELSEAESLQSSTLANHIQAIYNYKIALAQLERAIGEDIEE